MLWAGVFAPDTTTDGDGDGDGDGEGGLVKVCAVTDPIQVRRYLNHVSPDYEPPSGAPPGCMLITD